MTIHERSTVFARRGRGFTLIELMVSIGIIAVLASLLLPMAMRARRAAVRTKALGMLQTLSTGLEAYQQIYSSYPVFDNTVTALQADHSGTTAATRQNLAVDYGAHALFSALVGVWSPRNGGEKYGPFVNVDNIRVDRVNMWVLDDNKVQVLYIPASLPVVNIRAKIGPTNNISGFVANGVGSVSPLYDHRAVLQTVPTAAVTGVTVAKPKDYLNLEHMKVLLGDYQNRDGMIGGIEQAVTQQPYLLWMAGPDGLFGFGTTVLPAVGQPYPPNVTSDDITNFDFPPQFVRK